MVYDYFKEQGKKKFKGKLIIGLILLLLIILTIISSSIYMNIIQLDEIGGFQSIYVINLISRLIITGISFVLIFLVFVLTNFIIKRNLNQYFKENNIPTKKYPNFLLATAISLVGAFLTSNMIYLKALKFFNSTGFGKNDPVFLKDIGYYVFQRPFFLSIYDFVFTLWIFVIIYTIGYYLVALMAVYDNITLSDLKINSIIRHNLVNIALLFVIKAFSYTFTKENMLFSNFLNIKGAGYVDVNVWLKYFNLIPYVIIAIVIIAFFFILKNMLKKAAITIAIFPIIWILVAITASIVQGIIVKPNEINLESKYIEYNMNKTREAYKIDTIENYHFPSMTSLSPEIINRNLETKNNIRVVDYEATLKCNRQVQSNTNFYTFYDGDIVNYSINGKETPVFITAREIDKNLIPDKSYISQKYRYTHGYGVVINPINKFKSGGQVDFILRDVKFKSIDESLQITTPGIYYGELTNDYVMVNANGIKEIDKDGNADTVYKGDGGIELSFLNKMLFSLKFNDLKMFISKYITPDSKVLLNRNVVERVQKALPFLIIDRDPYIILTTEGKLKWVIDAYTTTDYYPYSQNYGNVNYIRNSVKVVVDAYNGKVKSYIIDKKDPIVNTYKKIYPEIFSDEPFPNEIAKHMKYPELLFEIQTQMLKRYHLDPEENPDNVSKFYTSQDLWEIAQYPNKNTGNTIDIDPYYNMIKLPRDIAENEELILMRPFTPSNKNNLVSWYAVRNSFENYGEMIMFNFPKNTNVFGPYQIEVKINQIDKVSKDITLWSQSGSNVFKGSLLVVPIENSLLYVEPIYIQASGESSIPEIRELVVGYQKGDEFLYGIGTDLDSAMAQLFDNIEVEPETPPKDKEPDDEKIEDEKIIDNILNKYDTLKQQLDELGELINNLRK